MTRAGTWPSPSQATGCRQRRRFKNIRLEFGLVGERMNFRAGRIGADHDDGARFVRRIEEAGQRVLDGDGVAFVTHMKHGVLSLEPCRFNAVMPRRNLRRHSHHAA